MKLHHQLTRRAQFLLVPILALCVTSPQSLSSRFCMVQGAYDTQVATVGSRVRSEHLSTLFRHMTPTFECRKQTASVKVYRFSNIFLCPRLSASARSHPDPANSLTLSFTTQPYTGELWCNLKVLFRSWSSPSPGPGPDL